MGTVTAQTPIFTQPLTGTVRIVQATKAGALPDLILALTGPIDLTLRAQSGLSKAGFVQTIFPEIADVPISRLELTLRGGKDGLLAAGPDLCSVFLPVTAEFVAHSGTARRQVVRSTPTGCKLKGSGTLTGASGKRPALTTTVVAGSRAIRSVSLTLPSSLRAPAAKRTRTVTARTGARSVVVRVGAGALTVTRRVTKVTVVADVKDITGKSSRLLLRIPVS